MLNRNKRMFQPAQIPPYNYNTNTPFQYEFERVDKQLKEMQRIIDELSRRLNILEGYLGINNQK